MVDSNKTINGAIGLKYGADVVASVAAGFKSNPKYKVAINLLARDYIANYRTGILAHLTNEYARASIGFYILYATFMADSHDGLNQKQVEDFCRKNRLMGRTRIRILLFAMEVADVIRTETCVSDKRNKSIQPTQKLFALAEKFYHPYLLALSYLDDRGPFIAKFSRDGLLQKSIIFMHDHFVQHGQYVDRKPLFKIFTSRMGGMAIALKLLLLKRAAQDESGEKTINFNYGQISKSLNVSRGHIRDLVNAAQRAGLINSADAGGNQVDVNDTFVDLVEGYFCLNLALVWCSVVGHEKTA